MQFKSLLGAYQLRKIDDRQYSKVVYNRLKLINDFKRLRNDNTSINTAISVLGVSRATIYRYIKAYESCGLKGLEPKSKIPKTFRKADNHHLTKLIKEIRRKNPTWGKLKIHTILLREHNINKSISTVGRIISKLIATNKVKPAYFAANKNKPKRKRVFKKHAKRWQYGQKAKQPGEMLQIDHMSVYENSKGIKHFKAVCPVSKYMFCKAYNSAKSKNAVDFLKYVLDTSPFAIKSIQVDGGSEFMKYFEEFSAMHNIPLYVLPPRSPKYNGCVERCNGTTRDEFYSQYQGVFELGDINKALIKYQNRYNSYRPHQSIYNLTPFQYLETIQCRAS